MLCKIVAGIEGHDLYWNTHPKCEPQLGKRGLYKELTNTGDTMSMLWVLNLSDGQHSLQEGNANALIPVISVHRELSDPAEFG